MDINLIDKNLYVFDIHFYLQNNLDLIENGITDEIEALKHWTNSGKNEKRNYKYIHNQLDFYINEFNKFIEKNIFTKDEAWDLLLNISRKHQNIDNENSINEEITTIEDEKNELLINIENKFSFNKEKSKNNNIEDFDWNYYINNNSDLIKNGINNKNNAINHWLNYGINEDRKYKFLNNSENYNINKKKYNNSINDDSINNLDNDSFNYLDKKYINKYNNNKIKFLNKKLMNKKIINKKFINKKFINKKVINKKL